MNQESGIIKWIGIRPKRKADLTVLNEVEAIANFGLKGDHYGKPEKNRQVTLIDAEHIASVALELNQNVSPLQLRRNIVTQGINLHDYIGKVLTIGVVKLYVTGLCNPCNRMNENLGQGGLDAMRGYGGITARILEGGIISVNDLLIPA